MSKLGKILYYGIIIATALCFVVAYIYMAIKCRKQELLIEDLNSKIEYYENLDTTFVHHRDSIEYNIIHRDSTIYDIIHEYEIEKETVSSMSDSAVVDKFKELVWAE